VIYMSPPGVQRVVEVGSRKGVRLDIRLMPTATRTPQEAAAAVDAELGQIVRSVVYVAPRPEGRLVAIVVLASGRNQIDPSYLTAVTGEMAIREATAREARDLTGYSSGGIPPFGYEREVRIVMDQDLARYQWVWAAAGADTALLRVAPRTLRVLANAVVAPLSPASRSSAADAPRIEPGRRPLQFGARAWG
jgi:prolyl-tRNA editing enzyme YbaK/EbsC (Cys-tRNA(Pro) deacylase)